MSQGVEIFNLARTAYLRIIPHLMPAGQVALAVVLGGLAFGPVGVFPGAAAGAALSAPAVQEWIRTAIAAFSGVMLFIQHQPELVQLVRNLLDIMRRYLSGNHEGIVNQENHALEN